MDVEIRFFFVQYSRSELAIPIGSLRGTVPCSSEWNRYSGIGYTIGEERTFQHYVPYARWRIWISEWLSHHPAEIDDATLFVCASFTIERNSELIEPLRARPFHNSHAEILFRPQIFVQVSSTLVCAALPVGRMRNGVEILSLFGAPSKVLRWFIGKVICYRNYKLMRK